MLLPGHRLPPEQAAARDARTSLLLAGWNLHRIQRTNTRTGIAARGLQLSVPSLQNRWHRITQNEHDADIALVAIPALVGMLLDPFIGVINSALVGHLGTKHLGAVSVGSLAVSFCTFLFSFLLFLTTPEIAAALSKQDSEKVSKIAAKGLWIAGGFGVITTAVVFFGAETIVNYLQPAEPAVAAGAIQFIRTRSWGMIPALLGYVAIGVLRGHKDTRTSLYAATVSAVSSLSLNALFLYVFDWGPFGSALAITLASTASCAFLCGHLLRSSTLRPSDLITPPTWISVMPMLRAGWPLSLRNAISFGMVMYASLLCVRAGSAYQAAFEVIRQVWILTIQSFECLNVATQVLCSAYLGGGDVQSARGVMLRLVSLSVVVGGIAGIVVFLSRARIAGFFTADPAVVTQVLWTLPMVAAFLPLDALASIMDGSLMASKQTNYLSYVQIAGAGVQYIALLYLASNNMVTTLSVWSCLKLLTLFRMAGGLTRNFLSSESAYAVGTGGTALGQEAVPVPGSGAGVSMQDTGRRDGPRASADEIASRLPSWALDSMDADCGAEPSGLEGWDVNEYSSAGPTPAVEPRGEKLLSSSSTWSWEDDGKLDSRTGKQSWDSEDMMSSLQSKQLCEEAQAEAEVALQIQEAGLERDEVKQTC